jgi:hypothetical protein
MAARVVVRGGSRARGAGEEGHLAQALPAPGLADGSDGAVALHPLHQQPSADHEVEPGGRRALLEEHVAAHQVHPVGGALQLVEEACVHGAQHRRQPAEELARVHPPECRGEGGIELMRTAFDARPFAYRAT